MRFASQADGLSASMALLVHNWQEILGIWLTAVENADDEALKPLLEYVHHSITMNYTLTANPAFFKNLRMI